MSGAVTCDGFLDGRLRILQPRRGYRAGVDPVLLAAAVPAAPGDSVLELGCGVGVASLCLGWRVPDLSLHGVELQPDYAELARRNAAANAIPLAVTQADLRALPVVLRSRSFDHVLANPPYYLREAGPAAAEPGREAARGEVAPLADWVDAGLRRLRPGGRLTVIQRAERLPELLAACGNRLGGIFVRPLAARPEREADRIILSGRKGGRAAFRLAAPLILHEGARHLADGDDYTPAAQAILRQGAEFCTT